MKNVEIKVNIVNEMRKIRSTVYGDRLAWVDELIQNTQRAKATEVHIQVEWDKVIVQDNGGGCDNPQVLFEKSESGWDESINSQNPFGEGFFSTIMVADKITVRSVGFESIFDVEKMFRENTIDCIEVKGSSRRSGFIVILENLNDEYREWSVQQRVKETAQYIKGTKFYLNGELIEHKDFTDTDGSKFSMQIDNEVATGWIRPFRWGGEYDGYGGDEYKLFAQERLVKEMSLSGVDGVVLAKENKIDLRSPDRKDVIYNEKRTKFDEVMKAEVKKVYLDVVQNGSDKDLDKYAELVDRYVPVEEYEKYLRFIYTTDMEDFKKILEIIKEKEKEEETVNFDEIAEMVEMEKQEMVEELEVRNEERETIDYEESQSNNNETEVVVRTGGEIRNNKATFYVRKKDIEIYQDKLALAEYHKTPVIIIRNKLEERVVEKKQGFYHIDELKEKVELSAQLKKVGAVDEVEERAMWLFEVLSKGLGFANNIFRIGDMTVYKETKVAEDTVTKEEEPALAIARGQEIYIDRSCLRKEKLTVSKSNRITNADRSFIVNNMETIAHELAHIMHGTEDNTKEHAEAQVVITNKILQGLF